MELTPEELFWSRVAIGPPEECWHWTCGIAPSGYGFLRWGKRKVNAHRVAWELTHGPIPVRHGKEELWVCHHCDNPPCCNPHHLFLGTPGDNAHDRDSKGRGLHGRKRPDLSQRNAKLTEDQVRSIRRSEAGTHVELAKQFGVHERTIGKIRNGNGWEGIE